jgi:hypothetical protein
VTINKHNTFNDPFAVIFLLIIYILYEFLAYQVKLLSRVSKLWNKANNKESKEINLSIQLEGYMISNVNIHTDDAIRNYYLKIKKGDLALKINRFISKADFVKDEGFIMQIMKQLEDINKKEEIEIIRKKLVQQNAHVPKKDLKAAQSAVIFSSKPEFTKLLVLL